MENKTYGKNRKTTGHERLDEALRILDDMQKVDAEGLQERIYNTVGRKKKKRSAGRYLLKYAAVLLPFLILGSLVWFSLEQKENRIDQIERYSDNVRLILGDGSEIILDREMDGIMIAENENFDIVREGDIITYKVKNGSAGAKPVYNILDVPRGVMFDLLLGDGTRVWLNSASRLRFPPDFNGTERRVYLEGEGYFEVAPDLKKPFIVETTGQELRVLGTVFNVSAYEDEAAVYTTLVEGSVGLRSIESNENIVLKPGQQAVLWHGEEDFITKKVNVNEFTDWRSGIFVFEGITLGQLMVKLSRWYDMEFHFEDDALQNMLLRGSMPRQSDVTKIFKLLEASGKVKFEVIKNTVHITHSNTSDMEGSTYI